MARCAQDLHEQPLLAGDAVRMKSDGTVRLIGGECQACKAKTFPLVFVCPECMSEDIADVELPDSGELYTWSVVHVAPKGWTVPYIAGYVDLPDSVRVFSHIVGADASELKMDMLVELTTATLGKNEDGPIESYAFTPVRR